MNVKCPGCGRESCYSAENPYRPFCSERCKTLDLGRWASEGFRIPVKNTDEQEDESPPPKPGESDPA